MMAYKNSMMKRNDVSMMSTFSVMSHNIININKTFCNGHCCNERGEGLKIKKLVRNFKPSKTAKFKETVA